MGHNLPQLQGVPSTKETAVRSEGSAPCDLLSCAVPSMWGILGPGFEYLALLYRVQYPKDLVPQCSISTA